MSLQSRVHRGDLHFWRFRGVGGQGPHPGPGRARSTPGAGDAPLRGRSGHRGRRSGTLIGDMQSAAIILKAFNGCGAGVGKKDDQGPSRQQVPGNSPNFAASLPVFFHKSRAQRAAYYLYHLMFMILKD